MDLLRRQRVVIVAALAGIAGLAWLYLFVEAADMTTAMAGMDRTMAMPPRRAIELLLLFAMWWVMMIGMMLPRVAPMILTFATVNRSRRARGQPYVPRRCSPRATCWPGAASASPPRSPNGRSNAGPCSPRWT